MAKFCRQCGKQLEDGEVCNCTPEQSMQVRKAKVSMVEIGKAIKGMILEPVSTMKSFISEENFYNALILIALNTISIAIMVGTLITMIYNIFVALLGLTEGFSSELSTLYTSVVQPIYMNIVVLAIMTMLLMSILIVGSIYLIGTNIWKKKVSYKTITTWLGLNSAFLIAVHLSVSVAILLNMEIALLVYIIGNIISVCYLCRGISVMYDVNENRVAYVVVPVVVLSLYVSNILVSKLL